ncbi:MAG: NADH-quinone oxidoreductase subunit C [Candidatus Margulisiibacteriota bacterium]
MTIAETINQEEEISRALVSQFTNLADKIKIQRARRMWAEVTLENFRPTFEYLVNQLGFAAISTITGLDEGENFGIIYHLNRDGAIVFSLKTSVPKTNPKIKTIIQIFPAADIYERELIDLLGIQVEGLPEGRRYPLPDNWPLDQHPLRKDWHPEALSGGGTTNV